MKAASILLTLVFSSVLCLIEIPKMLKGRLYKELWTFSIILALGVTLAILKSLDVDIPNPSDWVTWVYSPVSDFLKQVMD
ncbi:MAG: hypothetical protein ACM3KR_04210 [Deltaproteobacteria bacterium]